MLLSQRSFLEKVCLFAVYKFDLYGSLNVSQFIKCHKCTSPFQVWPGGWGAAKQSMLRSKPTKNKVHHMMLLCLMEVLSSAASALHLITVAPVCCSALSNEKVRSHSIIPSLHHPSILISTLSLQSVNHDRQKKVNKNPRVAKTKGKGEVQTIKRPLHGISIIQILNLPDQPDKKIYNRQFQVRRINLSETRKT